MEKANLDAFKPQIKKDDGEPSIYLVVGSIVCMVVSGVLAYKGWTTLYDNGYTERVVGGDAYNYIIYACRGTAIVCIGIVFALFSVTLMILALISAVGSLASKMDLRKGENSRTGA